MRVAAPPETARKVQSSKAFFIVACIALILQSGMLFLALFEPGLPYSIPGSAPEALDSPQFLYTLEALTSARVHRWSQVDALTNGEQYYPAELQAIRRARRTVNLEAYIFRRGDVARQFVDVLADRARAGVKVNLLVDAIGSAGLTDAFLKPLHDAGGRIHNYHALRWYSWPRFNNRTHRELLIVDGEVGFIGGAGFADHWLNSTNHEPRWRDTMVRVEGEAAIGLQSVFAENWLESAGEIITGPGYFPFTKAARETVTMTVGSSPTTGRSTDARILFQMLLDAAARRIWITTPYFLPDSGIRRELERAVQRGADVKIVVPGKHNDHTLTRRSSRRLYGELLKAGARIFEYEPEMIHAKSLIVDGLWSVVGSTNMDSRSFGLNDEVNLAVLDRQFASRLERDFLTDLNQSREITYEQWRKRSLIERVHEWFGALLERQQ